MSVKWGTTYGIPDVECPWCGALMEPVYFTEDEEKISSGGYRYKTGRVRRAVSHFECPFCFKKEVVDDSFDGTWRMHNG